MTPPEECAKSAARRRDRRQLLCASRRPRHARAPLALAPRVRISTSTGPPRPPLLLRSRNDTPARRQAVWRPAPLASTPAAPGGCGSLARATTALVLVLLSSLAAAGGSACSASGATAGPRGDRRGARDRVAWLSGSIGARRSMLRFVRTGRASANRAARPECVADQQSTAVDVTTRAVVI